MSQLPLSLTRCQHTYVPPPLAMDSSGMCWRPVSLLQPKHKPLSTFRLRVYGVDFDLIWFDLISAMHMSLWQHCLLVVKIVFTEEYEVLHISNWKAITEHKIGQYFRLLLAEHNYLITSNVYRHLLLIHDTLSIVGYQLWNNVLYELVVFLIVYMRWTWVLCQGEVVLSESSEAERRRGEGQHVGAWG